MIKGILNRIILTQKQKRILNFLLTSKNGYTYTEVAIHINNPKTTKRKHTITLSYIFKQRDSIENIHHNIIWLEKLRLVKNCYNRYYINKLGRSYIRPKKQND